MMKFHAPVLNIIAHAFFTRQGALLPAAVACAQGKARRVCPRGGGAGEDRDRLTGNETRLLSVCRAFHEWFGLDVYCGGCRTHASFIFDGFTVIRRACACGCSSGCPFPMSQTGQTTPSDQKQMGDSTAHLRVNTRGKLLESTCCAHAVGRVIRTAVAGRP